MSSTVDRLTLLWQISQLFSSTLELDAVLNLVIDEVVRILRAERGIVLLYDENDQLRVSVARGVDQQTLASPQFDFSRGVVERVAREGMPQLTSDAQDDRWLRRRESVIALGLRSVLCVPLQVKGRCIGVIYVDNRLETGVFLPADLELLTTIAASAATAIENARLYALAVEKGRMEQELQLARDLQRSFIPQELPQLEGWDLAASWVPARAVSGDYYDLLTADADSVGFVIGDVSDKGMAAALFMSLTRAVVRASVEAAATPAAGIGRANRLICADATRGMFVTLYYGRLDLSSGELTYVNAGHNPPWLYRAGEEDPIVLTRTGILIGVVPEAGYEQRSLIMAPGDLLLLYTDGLTDAPDAAGEPFGEKRVRDVVAAQRDRSPDTVVAALLDAVRTYTGGAPPFDDITLLLLRRRFPAPPHPA